MALSWETLVDYLLPLKLKKFDDYSLEPGAEHEHWLIGGLCWWFWRKSGVILRALYHLHGTGLPYRYQRASIIHLFALSSRLQPLGALA